MKRIQVEQLAERMLIELGKLGLAKKTLQHYKSLGLNPILRHFEQEDKAYYSITIAKEFWGIVEKSSEYDSTNDAKRQRIRKSLSLIEELAYTGTIVWKTLPHRRMRLLTPFYGELLCKFEKCQIDKGYQLTSLRGEKPVVKAFLHYLEDRSIKDLKNLTKEEVLRYIQIIADKYSRTADQLSILRLFFRYLEEWKYIDSGFEKLLQVRTASARRYYFGFTTKETEAILAAPSRETAIGKRDYAILSLAANTGMRAIDVLGLKFGDIDYDTCVLSIQQHKTGKNLSLPLPIHVCNAIAIYINEARPASKEPYIFLSARAPYRKLKSWSGYSLVKRNAEKIGFSYSPNEHKGFHSFRRSAGSGMLTSGISIEDISEVLGIQIDSAAPYLRTHHEQLERCAISLDDFPLKRRELQ